MAKGKKSYEYNGHLFVDNGHGDLYNAEVDKFLIFRPYPMMVKTVMHKDGSVTMNQEKFKENTDKNKGVYESGYEINDDGSVFVESGDVDEKIEEESEDNKNTEEGQEVQDRFEKEKSDFYQKLNDEDRQKYDNYLKEGYSQSDIENTLMYETQDERMREAGIEFAGEEHLSEIQVRAIKMYELRDIDYGELKNDYFNGNEDEVEKALEEYRSEMNEVEQKALVEKDNIKHEYTSYFTLESPLGDVDDAQSYLDEDDMTQYLDENLKEKVTSMRWVLDDDQSGHIEIKTNSSLTDQEQKELEDWIDGQNSDGLGEGFEQQDFANTYWNPDTGDGPYTYNEAEQEIDDMIENVSVDEYFDYIDESEIEAAIDTYLEDNDLITEYKENNWDSVKDEIFSFCSTDDIIDAAQTIKGDDLTDEEMDLVYDNFDSDPDYKEQVAEELWQNLSSYEQADLVKGLDQGDSLRDEARDGIYDDPEGYISDDVIFEAKQEYANQNMNVNIDDWGGMSSIRRSVDGLQDKVMEPEDDGETSVISPGVAREMINNGAQEIKEGYYNPQTGEGPYTHKEVLDLVKNNYDNMDFEDYREELDYGDIQKALKDYLRDGNYNYSFEDFLIENHDWKEEGYESADDFREYLEQTPEEQLYKEYNDSYDAWLDDEEVDFLHSFYTEDYLSKEAIKKAKDRVAANDPEYNANLWEERKNPENDIFKGYGQALPSKGDDRYLYGHNLSDAVDAINEFYGIDNRKEAFDRIKEGRYSKENIDEAMDFRDYDERRKDNYFGNNIPTFEEFRATLHEPKGQIISDRYIVTPQEKKEYKASFEPETYGAYDLPVYHNTKAEIENWDSKHFGENSLGGLAFGDGLYVDERQDRVAGVYGNNTYESDFNGNMIDETEYNKLINDYTDRTGKIPNSNQIRKIMLENGIDSAHVQGETIIYNLNKLSKPRKIK